MFWREAFKLCRYRLRGKIFNMGTLSERENFDIFAKIVLFLDKI